MPTGYTHDGHAGVYHRDRVMLTGHTQDGHAEALYCCLQSTPKELELKMLTLPSRNPVMYCPVVILLTEIKDIL